MVRGLCPLSLLPVDPRAVQAPGERRGDVDPVDAEPVVSRKREHAVVPPGVDSALGMNSAESIDQAPRGHSRERRPSVGVAENRVVPAFGILHVVVIGSDVEITAERERPFRILVPVEVAAEPGEPLELVLPLVGADLAAVRNVNTQDADSLEVGREKSRLVVALDVAERALDAREPSTAEDGDTVVALLPDDRGLVARPLQLPPGEIVLRHLELLETDDVGLVASESDEESRQARPNRVHVPGEDAHRRLTTV